VPWNQRYLEEEKKSRQAAAAAEKQGLTGQRPGTHYSHDLKDYAGEFTAIAYGRVSIMVAQGGLKMTFNRLSRPLEHFHYDTFAVPADPLDPIEKTKLTFITDLNGDISTLSIPLEPHVKPIVFQRTAEKQMFERPFLTQFTGDYDTPGAPLTVALEGESKLVLTRPGSPTQALRPKHGSTFEIESLPGETIEFKEKEMILYTADGVLMFKKK
jgi:hypothetical protein